MRKLLTTAVALSGALLAACSKDGVKTITAPTSGAYVKFFNFGINAPGVNFFANDTKVTAVSSTSCTPPTDPRCTTSGIETLTGTTYGNAGNAGLYSAIDPGQYSFNGRIATATDNGVKISNVSSTLAAGHYYSVFQSGFYDATAKNVDGFILEDVFPVDTPDFTRTYVRFVNASPNSSPMTMYAKSTVTGDSTLVGANIAYKAGGTFIPMVGGVYDLTVRYAGSNTGVIVRTGVSFSSSRVYTVSARGDMTVVSTTATNRPSLDNTANR